MQAPLASYSGGGVHTRLGRRAGVVPASDGTLYQEYVLTPKGSGLFPVVVGLRHWGEAHLYAKGEPHSVLVERGSGRPVQKIALHTHDGKPLRAADTLVKKLPARKSASRGEAL